MLIDWFTVIAQVINFLILVWLLKRFLYKPVLQAIEEREKKIATQLQEAAAQKAEAQKEEEKFEKMNQDLQQNKESLMTKAESEAKERKNQLLTEARKEYADLRSGMQQTLSDEQKKLTEEIAKRTRSEVFAIVKKMWTDLADADFDEKMTEVFIRRLREMKEEEKNLLRKTLASAQHSEIIIQSGYEISNGHKKTLVDLVRQLANIDCVVNFRMDTEKTNEIELRSNGYKLTWSARDYFASLEKMSMKEPGKIDKSYAG